MNSLRLSFCLVITLSVAKAQDLTLINSSIKKRSASIHLVIPAFAIAPASSINSALVHSGYPQLPRGSFNWGVGTHFRWSRFLAGLDLMGGYQTRKNDKLKSELLKTSLTTNLFVAYHVYRSRGLNLYPYVAISGTNNTLYLSKQTTTSGWIDFMSTPGNTVTLNHFSDGFIIGCGIDFCNLWKSTSAFESIKIGYRISPQSYSWESKFTPLDGAPMDRFNYFFFQLNLGVVWNWKD